ncbi:hypothetical protein [Algicola sagamiensis]|uniref:hypothetical protein n=1 Tax=Algicola sagamiensis TaxID=163869 RepID=UPI000379AC9B|nr:hypothetical protein [Algicola sagamiensis]
MNFQSSPGYESEKLKEKLLMTPSQRTAFRKFEKAYSECIQKGIHFEMLGTGGDTVVALNGNNIDEVSDDIDGVSLYELTKDRMHFDACAWVDCPVHVKPKEGIMPCTK